MHILLVNDDGITAVGITALLKEAAARGHRVTMAAPDRQQSAASHRLTLSEPIMMHPFTTGLPGVEAYAIKGSPADCVRVALLGGLVTDPVDVVISGINNGLNAGMDAHYSGTLGAAMEGAMLGYRAVAASIGWNADEVSLAALAALTLDWAERYCRIPAQPVSVLNINAPAVQARIGSPPSMRPWIPPAAGIATSGGKAPSAAPISGWRGTAMPSPLMRAATTGIWKKGM